MPRTECDISLITNEPRKRKLAPYITSKDNASADCHETIKRLRRTINPNDVTASPSHPKKINRQDVVNTQQDQSDNDAPDSPYDETQAIDKRKPIEVVDLLRESEDEDDS